VRVTRSSLKSTVPGRSLSSLLNQRPLKEAVFPPEIAIPAAAMQLVTGAGKEGVGNADVGVDFGEDRSAWTSVRSTSR
jgi:hypothetical protein